MCGGGWCWTARRHSSCQPFSVAWQKRVNRGYLSRCFPRVNFVTYSRSARAEYVEGSLARPADWRQLMRRTRSTLVILALTGLTLSITQARLSGIAGAQAATATFAPLNG